MTFLALLCIYILALAVVSEWRSVNATIRAIGELPATRFLMGMWK